MQIQEQIPPEIPKHLREFYGYSHHPLAKYLNCYCMAVLYHLPQCLDWFTEEIAENSNYAKRILFYSNQFEEFSADRIQPVRGDVVLYGAYVRRILFSGEEYEKRHAHIYISTDLALTKASYGIFPFGLESIEIVEEKLDHYLSMPGRRKVLRYFRKT